MSETDAIRAGKFIWKKILYPKKEIVDEFQREYGFHELDCEDCLSKTETPKLEEYKDYLFIVLHFPVKNMETEHISIVSLNVFIGPKFFITLTSGNLKKHEDFFEKIKADPKEAKEIFKKGTGYLLYLLLEELFSVYGIYISQLNRLVHEVEDEIFEGTIMKDRLYDIMSVKRQIITLKRALLPNLPIIVSLEQLHIRFISKKLELYFDNVRDKISRGESSLNAMNDVIKTLHSANEALTSHNTNRVMKILTIFSVTLLPLNLLAGIYGMNVQLPLAEHEKTFLAIMGLMIVTFIVMMVAFRWKRYI